MLIKELSCASVVLTKKTLHRVATHDIWGLKWARKYTACAYPKYILSYFPNYLYKMKCFQLFTNLMLFMYVLLHWPILSLSHVHLLNQILDSFLKVFQGPFVRKVLVNQHKMNWRWTYLNENINAHWIFLVYLCFFLVLLEHLVLNLVKKSAVCVQLGNMCDWEHVKINSICKFFKVINRRFWPCHKLRK